MAAASLDVACAAVRHRGPNQAGSWISRDGAVGLAAVRLAVLDPTAAGDQPMHRAVSGGSAADSAPEPSRADSASRYHIAYNGEVYNFAELRHQLEQLGHRFVTRGDTEVVLAACAAWGVAALARFNGMWALAFYDSQTRQGFLARDRFGIKPLFYTTHGPDCRLAFCSELAGIMHLTRFPRDLDRAALQEHLQFGMIAHPRSIYAAVRRLPPGCVLHFDAAHGSEPRVEKYFSPVEAMAAQPRIGDYAQAMTEARGALASAVGRRRVSDVPLGAFLSGGLDSSIVVAHLAAASSKPVQTFSIGHAEQPQYDETHFARLVAREFGTEHHELRLTQRDVLDAIPRVLDHLSEPVADSSIIPTWLVSRLAASRVTVSLSGDAGDELFGGYWRYLAQSALAAYLRWPGWLRRGVFEPVLQRSGAAKSGGLANRMRQFRKLLRAAGEPDVLSRHVAWMQILSPEASGLFGGAGDGQGLGDPATSCARLVAAARELTDGMPADDELARVLAFDLQFGLPADMLQKVDLASMAHGLEVRVPFLDPEVVAVAMRTPSSFKIYRGLKKRVLLDAYRGRLPDAVLDRPKQGFEVPIGEYLRDELQPMFRDVVTRERLEQIGGLSLGAMERLYEEHCTRRAEHADVLFALLSLCWWAGKPGSLSAG